MVLLPEKTAENDKQPVDSEDSIKWDKRIHEKRLRRFRASRRRNSEVSHSRPASSPAFAPGNLTYRNRHARGVVSGPVWGSISVQPYPNSSAALERLTSAATKFEPIMRRLGWKVTALKELDIEDASVLGKEDIERLQGWGPVNPMGFLYALTQRKENVVEVHIRLHYSTTAPDLVPEHDVVHLVLSSLARMKDIKGGPTYGYWVSELKRMWKASYGEPTGGWQPVKRPIQGYRKPTS